MPDFTPRPTVYKGIKMRSRLEAGFAQWLDQTHIDGWKYEPGAFGSSVGQYLPDFWIPQFSLTWEGTRTLPAYIEVKPQSPGFEGLAALARKMSVVWESDPECHLLLFAPHAGSSDGFPIGVVVNEAMSQYGPPDMAGFTLTLPARGHLGATCVIPNSMRPWPDNWWEVT